LTLLIIDPEFTAPLTKQMMSRMISAQTSRDYRGAERG
jgi:hypothetical protein